MNGYAIIPAYNEEKNIGEVIDEIFRIGLVPLVINDGSTDKTKLIARMKTSFVISHSKNRGKGESIRTAFDFLRNKDFDYVVIIDADMQYFPREAGLLIDGLKDADYVVGERNWNQVPFRHMLGNLVWIKLFNSLFKTNLNDVCCGFVAMKREVALNLELSGGYVADSYMIIQALRMGYKVKNTPVSVVYNHKRGFISGVRMVIGILIFMIRLRQNTNGGNIA